MSARLLPVPVLVTVLALVPLLLTGCGVSDALQHRTAGTVATPAALQMAWRTPASEPDRVPEDATGIHSVAATGGSADAGPASVRVTTTSALPKGCTEITRRSLDSFGESWARLVRLDPSSSCGGGGVAPARAVVEEDLSSGTGSQADVHLRPGR